MSARVLIVDDNESLRRVFSALLTQAGYQVLAALPDGSKLVDWMRRETPDIVCLDYHLPGRDGLSLLADIDKAFPQVDVLFMTASGEASLEQRAADAGAAGFLHKPFSQTQVLAELRAVCDARQQAGQGNARSEEAPRRRHTAVVADDSAAVRLVLKGLLEEAGVRVVQTVANGSEALNALRHHQPDLLCLDVNMPVMDGIEALPQAVEISPETLIVMVTGCNDRQLIAQAAGLGAKGYILKPLRPAYVEGLVRKLFGARQG
ncbi:MAG: response regulator [Azonexus sp.]|jgi:CheY-like chemotaxis protein|nr:response regulator [Azonexus sp.]